MKRPAVESTELIRQDKGTDVQYVQSRLEKCLHMLLDQAK
jgi:hypothetical protein